MPTLFRAFRLRPIQFFVATLFEWSKNQESEQNAYKRYYLFVKTGSFTWLSAKQKS